MKLLYADLEQAESRTVGAILFRLFGDTKYLDLQESGDPHSLVCSMCWDNLPWPQEFCLDNLASFGGTFPPELVSAAKKVAGEKAYRDMSYRDLAKRLSHGSNYRGAPPTMSKHTHVDVEIIKNFQSAYFGAFPHLREWHRWVAEQLQLHRNITTMLGRRRWFFGRPDDDATLREAIAFEPQSVATGDYMNLGLMNVWRENWPLWMFSQVHDAIAAAYDERDEHWIVDAVCRKLQTPIPLVAPDGCRRQFAIPTEAFVGWNLGKRTTHKDKDGRPTLTEDGTPIVVNPDGLVLWTGQDDRKRQVPLKRQITDFDLKKEIALMR